MGIYDYQLSLIRSNRGVKELIKEIDNDIESMVRGEAFYNRYHHYDTKSQMYDREIDYTKYCFQSKYKSRLEELGLSNDQIDRLHGLLVFQQRSFHFESNYSFLNEDNKYEYVRIEKELDNNKRLGIIKERETQKEDPQYGYDRSVHKLSRWISGDHAQEYNFYKMNNSEKENDRLLDKNMYAIEFVYRKEDRPEKQRAIRCAQLWAELREKGSAFSPGKMEELANLERSPYLDCRGGVVGIVELGRINKELGIIKSPRDAKVFPEYESVTRQLEQLAKDEQAGKYQAVDQFKEDDMNRWHESFTAKQRAFDGRHDKGGR